MKIKSNYHEYPSAAVPVVLSIQANAQVCPTATFNTQYNQVTNLGGNAENPTAVPFTYAYTAGAGINRLMILSITYETENTNGPNNFAAVTYGGVALTNVINQTISAPGTQRNRLAMYYLRENGIASRVSNTVSISFTNPGGASPNGSINGVAVNTILFENVDQVTPLLNIQSAVNVNTTTITIPSSFTATAGNYVIAAVNMALATATVGPSTPDYTVYISQQVTGSHTHSVSFKQIIASGIEQPGFTANVSTRQIIGSLEVKALTAGGSCSGGLLPVKVTSFSANPEGSKVRLLWKTESESNIASYNIQRKSASGVFEMAGSVSARNLSVPSSYLFYDQSPLHGTSFYRLQVVGLDGMITYSNIIKVSIAPEDVFIIASPAGSTLNISAVSSQTENALITLYDNTARKFLTKSVLLEKGWNNISLPLDISLAKGVYFITVYTARRNRSFRFIKE